MTAPQSPTTEALKPCPFCGAAAQIVVFGKGQSNERHGVRCADLTCGGMVRLGTMPGESADLWNTRPSPIAEPQDSDAAGLVAYHAEQLATYIALPSISAKNLASARYHNDKIRSIAARLEAPNVEALIGQSSESDELTDEYLNALHASVKVPDNLTPIDRSEGDVVPVAWRWRYVDPRGPRHWVVRQSPLESHDAAPGYCALEVEPLYTRAARLEAPITEDALVERVIEAAQDVVTLARNEGVAAGNGNLVWGAAVNDLSAALQAIHETQGKPEQ